MIEARSEVTAAETGLPTPIPRLPPRLAAGARPHGLAPTELVKLHHSLAETLDADHGVIAQFVAPEPDAAIESVVYDLAYISAAWLGKRVLFVNGVAAVESTANFAPASWANAAAAAISMTDHVGLAGVSTSTRLRLST